MASKREGTNDLWEAIYTQRAIRKWEDRPVPEDLIWRVIEAGTKAPSGSNLQPWRFVVIQDAERRGAIAAMLRQYFESDPEAKARMTRLEASRSERLITTGARHLYEALDDAPVFIVACLYGITSP